MTAQLESSIVRIRAANGIVVGAGFLVGHRQVLTCAHVVTGALGLPDDTPETPKATMSLDFPLVAPGRILTARVILWQPPRRDGGGDVAGLALDSDPPAGAQTVRLVTAEDLWGHPFRAFGFPKGYDNGVWASGRILGREATGWVQVEDVKQTGYFVAPGFSGAPVWDEQLDGVIGMTVAAERRPEVKAAFIIPTNVLVRNWSELARIVQTPAPITPAERQESIESKPAYYLYIQPGEWLWFSLLCLVGLGLVFAILRVILQLSAAWSLSLSIVCLVLVAVGSWLAYNASQQRKFARYQRHLITDLQSLKFLSRQIDLERAFVSLRICEEFHSPLEQTEREVLSRLRQKETRYEMSVEIDEAVDRYPALLVLGEPGAGKTTLLKHLALRFARERSALPLFIPLYEFAEAVNQQVQKGKHGLTLLDYLPMALQRSGFTGGRRFLMRKIERGDVVLLLDGLDEVPDDDSRRRTIQAINQFMRGYSHNRIVVTSRIAIYLATQGRLDRFQHTEVLEFTPAQMGQFVRVLLSSEDANRLERIFRAKAGLRNIGRNPLLLSVIVTVYEKRDDLPERRVDLYEWCMLILLEHWEREKPISRVDFDRFPVHDRLRRLEEIAFHFHQQGGAIDKSELIDQVRQLFDVLSQHDAEAFLDEIVRYSGILRQESMRTYAFWHLSFREYLSARYLARQVAASGIDVVLPYVSQARWEETLLFLAGILEDATELIRAIVTHEPDKMRGLSMAARCLVDGEKTKAAVRAEIIKVLVNYLLDESDAAKRQYAETVLTEVALVREVIAFLRWTLLKEADLTTVARVSWVFAGSNAPEVLQTFIRALDATADWVRQWLILGALQRLNVPESGEALRKAYPTLASDMRARGAVAITAITEDEGSEDFLSEQLLGEPDVTVLAVMVNSLLNSVRSTAWVKRLEQNADEARIREVAHIIAGASVQQVDRLEEISTTVTQAMLRDGCREALSAAQSSANSEDSLLLDSDSTEATPIETENELSESVGEASDLSAMVDAFRSASAGNDWGLQVHHLVNIARCQGEQATQALIEALDPPIAWPVRQVAAGLLASKGEMKANAAILDARDSPPTHIIDNQSLESLRKSLAIYGPLLRSGALDEWEEQMVRASEQLQADQASSELTGNETAEQLLSYLQSSDTAARLRWQAVSILGERSHQEAVPDLIRVLEQEESDWELRRRATIALGQLKNPAAVSILAEHLIKEERWDVQTACAIALAKIGTLQALQSLIVALVQAEPQNRADILAALLRFSIPLDGVLSTEHLEMVGQVARQSDALDWELYQVMNLLYQDILVKAGLESGD